MDAGVLYLNYIERLDACVGFEREAIGPDRPNLNGMLVDGPILEKRYESGVGAIPVPVLHGLTMGEIARMAVGEGWVSPCDLTVVPCRNYTHRIRYELPVAPSPNLRTQRAVYLYPSVCLFEGTVLSVGRGTDKPFEVYGHPDLPPVRYPYAFTPRPSVGAKDPLWNGRLCFGRDLSRESCDSVLRRGLGLEYLIEAYRELNLGEHFFKPVFEKLIGVGYVRRMIVEGYSADEIRSRWQEDVELFRIQRKPYLLYEE